METVLLEKINVKNKINNSPLLKLKKIKAQNQRKLNNNISTISFNKNPNQKILNDENKSLNLKDKNPNITKNSENKINEVESSESSTKTDCSSSEIEKQEHSVKKILIEETEGKPDNVSRFNEDEEDVLDKDKKRNKCNELTNKIKSVFIEQKVTASRTNSYASEASTSLSNGNNRNSISSINSLTEDVDYILEFCRNGEDLRKSYLEKLITKNIWNPNRNKKTHNSIFIFDWDDTLLPTSFLSPGGVFDLEMKLSRNDKEKLSEIEKEVSNILNNAINKGEVYIITNAEKGWVEFSASKFYPSITNLLSKIKIISAREEYEQLFPNEIGKWKIEAFLNLQKYINQNLVTNLICFGDSKFDIKAGKILASRFREAFIKTIKFKEAPRLDDLFKQLNLVSKQFNYIYSSIKNMTIKVERKN